MVVCHTLSNNDLRVFVTSEKAEENKRKRVGVRKNSTALRYLFGVLIRATKHTYFIAPVISQTYLYNLELCPLNGISRLN